MENHVKKQFVLLSIGKLRRLKSTDLSDLLEDDGKGFYCSRTNFFKGVIWSSEFTPIHFV